MAVSLAALELEWSTTPAKWIAIATFNNAAAAARAVRSAAAASKVSIRAIAFGEGQGTA
jgi:hypothetical protein